MTTPSYLKPHSFSLEARLMCLLMQCVSSGSLPPLCCPVSGCYGHPDVRAPDREQHIAVLVATSFIETRSWHSSALKQNQPLGLFPPPHLIFFTGTEFFHLCFDFSF